MRVIKIRKNMIYRFCSVEINLSIPFLLGFPGGASGKETACQCRRCKRGGFDPWVGRIPWRRAWQPTPVFLPGESHGQRSLADYSPQGHCKDSDMTEATQHTYTTHSLSLIVRTLKEDTHLKYVIWNKVSLKTKTKFQTFC